jgi:hypothetical protein
MQVVEAIVCHPINAIGGLYVLIEGTQSEVYSIAASHLAMEIAEKEGWKSQGKATVGIPSRKGILVYTKAFWFHERK